MFSVGLSVSIDDYSHTKYDLMWISSTSHDGPDYNMNLALILYYFICNITAQPLQHVYMT